jgi:Tol biopolymer transport system component
MALQPGAILGSYEIVHILGAGGMGEVYLARELNLGRRVALKVLPPEFTHDASRIARFEQEARSASALSHPNICTIFALGEMPDGRHFIAMEYIEGQTLRHRLMGDRLPLRAALDICTQIAGGVSAAHARGIVHRDLKPENVLIRPDGLVKVVDFGLAKLALTGGPERDGTTQLWVHTDPGSAVGTIEYMSPEQARAQEVDARTDIWSLGVLLYEMVAGRTPFAGNSSSDVLAGILDREAPMLARFDASAPPELQRIVGKALRKDRDQRYQGMKDLLLDLQALRDDVGGQAASGQVHERRAASQVSQVTTESLAPPVTGGMTPSQSSAEYVVAGLASHKVVVALVACILTVIAAAAWWAVRSRKAGDTVMGSAVPVHRTLTRLTFGAGLQTGATWSPDGRFIAFASDTTGNFDIWVQAVAGGAPVQLTRSRADDTQPSWSPDGTRIVFRSERDGGGLFLVPALGGPERQVTSLGVYPQWTPDGAEILFRVGGQGFGFTHLNAVSAEGGKSPREVLAEFLAGGNWDWIASHPDGRISALGVHRTSGVGFFTVSRDARHVIQSALARGLPLPLGEANISSQGTRVVRFVWNAAGTALTVEALVNEVRNVWRVHVDPKTLEWQSAEQLTAGAGADVGVALSHDGTRIVFTTELNASRLWVFPFDAATGRLTGAGRALTPEEGRANVPDLAPDGNKVAYTLRRPGTQSVDLWALHIDTGERELLAQNVISYGWSPDGKSIAYSLFRADRGEWVLAVRALSGPERLLGVWSKQSALLPSDWTRDGTAILGSYLEPVAGLATLALWPSSDVSPKPQRILMAEAAGSLWQGRFSPDGRWLSFVVQRNRAEGLEIMVAPAAGAPATNWARIAPDHIWADKPRWAPDSRTLYFLSQQNTSFFNLWGVRIDRARGRPSGEPFMITHFDSRAMMIDPDMAYSDIGISANRAVLTMAKVTGSIWMLDNVDR